MFERDPKRSNVALTVFAVGILGLLLTTGSCTRDDTVRDLGTRAVVIGIDGADPAIMARLAEEGHLPNFSHLRDRGVWGEIDTLRDIPLSPVIWTSVATGKTAEKHGISWFMVDQANGTRVPVRSYNRKAEAIWNILARHDRRASVVGWWATYPAEDVGGGRIVSDALGFHGFGRTARSGDDGKKTYPAGLYEEVSVLIPPEQQITAEFAQRFLHLSTDRYQAAMYTPARNASHDPGNPIHLFQQYAVTAEGYTAIAEKLLAEPQDLTMVYFEQIDSFSHLFMKYAPPRLEWIDEAGYEAFRDVVTEWYKYQDRLLGRLLDQIDLSETAVFILSDHGFKSGDRRIRSEEIVDIEKAHLDHESRGIFLAAGPHVKMGERIEGASVLDITPTLLHYLGFAVGKDMDGKVLETAFDADFRQDNPIRYVPTHEPPDDERPEPAIDSGEGFSQQKVADNLAALETLGYLGGSSKSSRSAKGSEEGGSEASSPEIHNNLGRVHLAKGEVDDAIEQFQKALALDPNNASALLNIGSIFRSQGRLAQATQLVKQALQVNPNSIGALSQLAEIEKEEGNLEGAIRLFAEALQINDSQPFLFNGLGDVLLRAGRLEKAQRAFQHALELDPDSYKALYNLGVTLESLGQEEAALEHYSKSLELAPSSTEAANAHNNIGTMHLRRGEIDDAAARYRSAVRILPQHFEALYNLALIHLQRDEIDQAIELLEQASNLQPNHEVVTTRLGMAYLSLNRADEALRSFVLVRRLYPQNWVALVGLAVLSAHGGESQQARELLAKAERLGGEAARSRAALFPVLAEL